jgi:hypothetical protein
MMKASAPCLVVIGLGLVFTACEDQPAKPPAALVTMATLQKLAGVDRFGAGLDPVFTEGFEPEYFLRDNKIRIASAFTEMATSAYMTTDIWVNFPEVWVQPLYIVKTNVPAETRWLFSVAEDSKFYSPYWRAYTVIVPDGTAAKYNSVRDVLDAKLPISAGRGRLAALVPTGVKPALVSEDAFVEALLAPLPAPKDESVDKLAGTYKVGHNGWVDGSPRDYIDFGVDRFEWNERDEVVEAPLFFFFVKRPNLSWGAVTDLPRVGGTGPLYGRRPAIAPTNRPLFGSFWRLWGVHLPESARVFIPPVTAAVWMAHTGDHKEPHDQLRDVGSKMIAPASDPAVQASINRHAFQVVLDDKPDAVCMANATTEKERLDCQPVSCVETATTAAALDACAWLDSQAAIEDHITKDRLLPSQILVSCPYLAYDSKPSPLAEAP